MQPQEKNPRFSNPLINSSSPYLRQHAHNPVFWYPWGKEAIDRARDENKPILLSIGYSTCHWCHVMERDVFVNLSIASLMNKFFINIKVDREEHPELDELYMIARQMLTKEGGWPNNIFLTPDLKPFYAGGTFGANEMGDKPPFPRLLEWLNYCWTEQEKDIRKQADEFTELLQPFAVHQAPKEEDKLDIAAQAHALFKELDGHHDDVSGGFYHTPKFPQECYLNFLLSYYESTKEEGALNIVANSLGKMAAGGIFDQVSPSFHRYAIDKEWYVPHFEKMLYNQALLARLFTRTAVATKSGYFKDTACGVLDFVAGPLTDGNGAFFTAIDAETNEVEGDYYTWTPQELQEILRDEEINFMTQFFALADVPEFSGHKHTQGKVLIARKPLPLAAKEADMPYEQLAALSGTLMNKLLVERNKRYAPALDNKIITAWNGMMITAYAEASIAFSNLRYLGIAQKAADYILENGFDSNGVLQRVIGSDVPIAATFEDYAYLIQGLIALQEADPDDERIEVIDSLIERMEELFGDEDAPGYFLSQEDEYQLFRMKSGDDSSIPSAAAVMLQNFAALYRLTKQTSYQEKAEALQNFFLKGNERPLVEFASMVQGALELHAAQSDEPIALPKLYEGAPKTQWPPAPDGVVSVSAAYASEEFVPGEMAEVVITVKLADGWHINAFNSPPPLIRTRMDVFGKGFKPIDITYPSAIERGGQLLYEGTVHIKVSGQLSARVKKLPKLKVRLSLQPCSQEACHQVQHLSLTT